MKRYIIVSRDTEGQFINLFKDNRSYSRKRTASYKIEQIQPMFEVELLIKELEVPVCPSCGSVKKGQRHE